MGYKGVTEENIETIRNSMGGNYDVSAYCVNWCKRARICHNIINNKGGNDTAAVIRFSNTVISDSGLSYNKSYLNDQLPNINNGSGTANLNNALNTALSHVETDTTDVYRLVVITDNNINFGQISSSDFPDNVIFNIVNLGSSAIGRNIEAVAQATGGDVYDVASASDLTYESGGMVYIPPQFIGEDYDGDGIPDLVELYGLKPNGQPIESDPELEDTDDDGLKDNEELHFSSETMTYELDKSQYDGSVFIWSDPCLKDTNGDELDDKEEREADTNPRVNDTDGDGALDGRDKYPLSPSDTIYDRNAAYDYSQKYYENYNDDYPSMEHGDCANFVSQCLYAGGLEMNSYWYMKEHHFYDRFGDLFSNKAQNWSYEWSLNWTIANDQYNYFNDAYAINVYKIEREDSISEFVKSHPNIQVGDLLYFHNADETKDVNHATIISVVTESEIKYAVHTGSRDQYPLSDAIKHNEDGEYSYDYVYIIQMSDAV